MRRNEARGPITWLAALLVLYLAIPLAAFSVRLIQGPERGFHTPGLLPALWTSVIGATISLGLITIFGIPLAYYLARSDSRLSRVVGVVVVIPLALPPVMAGIILIYVVGPYTYLGQLFSQHLTESLVGIVIAMTFCAAPFLIVTARTSFAAVDQGFLDVAGTLGHSQLSRFFRVSVPLAGPGIRAGMTLSWLRAFGEYGAVVILAYNPASLPVYTYNQFSSTGLPTTLAPTALALSVAVIVVTIGRFRLRPRSAVRTLPAPSAPLEQLSRPVGFDVSQRLGAFHLAVSHESSSRHLAILGESGSGKSALLRCVAGLYGSSCGPVQYGSDVVSNERVEVRHVGYLAQGFSLFPHLTVWQQLLFARGATPEIAAYWLHRLRLSGLENRYPTELSGGQRQRVALAQVLCRSPHVLLLDEPFSALDMPVRRQLRRELRNLQHETGIATMLVTHDPDEAAFLSSEVIVIARGREIQSGVVKDVFARPRSAEVAGLLGIANVFDAVVIDNGDIDTDGTIITTNSTFGTRSRVQWSIRPEHVKLRPISEVDAQRSSSRIIGTVTDVADLGARLETFVRVSDEFEIEVHSVTSSDLQVGDFCEISLPDESIVIWPVHSSIPIV